MAYVWFAFSAFLVILAGSRLTGYGDTLAVHTRWGHGLVGGILIAGVTSLPELVSSISAAVIGAPDIAFGNVFGSNAFNLTILAIVDMVQGRGGLLSIVRDSHILTAMFGILLTGFSVLSIWMTPFGVLQFTLGWVSSNSLFILAFYIFSTVIMIRYEEKTKIQLETDINFHRNDVPESESGPVEEISISDKVETPEDEMQTIPMEATTVKRAVVGFSFAGLIIIFAGIMLSVNADLIARETGLGQTFVGSFLVAGATSLPELVAAIAAIRIGAYDMAVGNVLGSNVFNIMILVATDLAYTSGSVYEVVSTQHLITAITTMILSSIAVLGLFYRSKRTILTLGWDSLAIMMGYVAMMYALFKTSR